MHRIGRRWIALLLLTTSLAVMLAGVAWHRVTERRAARQREARYDETVNSYRRVLPLGTTREAVDAYLRKAGRPVMPMCCMATTTPVDERVLDILTKIGTEAAPFYCSEHNVYVGFHFATPLPRRTLDGTPSDTLVEVSLYRLSEGCW